MSGSACYRIADGVAIRPERFGALVYRYDNRRLYFIHSHAVADFVSGLNGARPLDDAIADFVTNRNMPVESCDSLRRTIGQLERLGLIGPVVET